MKSLIGSAWVLLLIAIGFVAGHAWGRRQSVTLISLSPDDRSRVHLIETNGWIDRNFQLRLERLDGRLIGGPIETLFPSPDEDIPIGSERILWSPDSRRFVLVGRHFLTRDGTPRMGGESLYLLFDLESGKLWCNASQQSGPGYPTFEARDAAWAGPIVQRGGP